MIDANKPWQRGQRRGGGRSSGGSRGCRARSRTASEEAKKAQLREAARSGARRSCRRPEEREKAEVQMYEVELDRKSVHLTHEGIQEAQEYRGRGELLHRGQHGLAAPAGAEPAGPRGVRARQGVRGGARRTGRSGDHRRRVHGAARWWGGSGRTGCTRRWRPRRRVRIKPETQTMATVTLQNFFKLYKRLAGMTGTAMTEADEFMKIYKLDVVTDPDEPAGDPRGLRGPDLHERGGQVERDRRADQDVPREGPAGAGGHDERGEERAAEPDADAAVRDRARGAERQEPRARGGNRGQAGQQHVDKLGRTVGRGDDRDEHGGARHGHQAGAGRGGGGGVVRVGDGAARGAADRQSVARAFGAAGGPGRVAVPAVAAGRSDEAVCRGLCATRPSSGWG